MEIYIIFCMFGALYLTSSCYLLRLGRGIMVIGVKVPGEMGVYFDHRHFSRGSSRVKGREKWKYSTI
jgi:hypothetical protein